MSSFEALELDPTQPLLKDDFASYGDWLEAEHARIFESDEGLPQLRESVTIHRARRNVFERAKQREIKEQRIKMFGPIAGVDVDYLQAETPYATLTD